MGRLPGGGDRDESWPAERQEGRKTSCSPGDPEKLWGQWRQKVPRGSQSPAGLTPAWGAPHARPHPGPPGKTQGRRLDGPWGLGAV